MALGVPPYIQNQPSGHMGLDMGSHYPPRAPLYSHTGLRPLCYELCSDNGHFPPVWAYQAGLTNNIYAYATHTKTHREGYKWPGGGGTHLPCLPIEYLGIWGGMGFYEPHYVVLKIKNHIVWFFGTRPPSKF